MPDYGAVELPPLTQTKNTTQKPKNRIVLCHQLCKLLCRGELHNTKLPMCRVFVAGRCVVSWSARHNAQPQLSCVKSISKLV